MKHWWKPAGPAAFVHEGWRVQKDWASGLWDIYCDGAPVKTNMDSATDAINEAERMMGDAP